MQILCDMYIGRVVYLNSDSIGQILHPRIYMVYPVVIYLSLNTHHKLVFVVCCQVNE